MRLIKVPLCNIKVALKFARRSTLSPADWMTILELTAAQLQYESGFDLHLRLFLFPPPTPAYNSNPR